MSGGADLVAVFLRWIWWRAVLYNGWWLVTSVYLVVDADLSPSQLVLIGVAQGVVALVFEIPAGVVADTISRKWSLVVNGAAAFGGYSSRGSSTSGCRRIPSRGSPFSAFSPCSLARPPCSSIACAAGVVGLVGLAGAPEEVSGSAAVLLVAVIARFAGLSPALVACGALFAITIVLILRLSPPSHTIAAVAYDEKLAERIRELVGSESDLTEKKMFGGLAFLIGGNMAVAASGQGGVLVRVDPAESDTLVATTNARPMEMRGREMQGWLRVDTEDVRTKRQLAKWVQLGTAYARSLPAKR